MCRSLSYLGPAVPVSDLFFSGDASFINQTTAARLINMTNMAGAGFAVWNRHSPDPEMPLLYRTTRPAVLDRNLSHLAQKLTADAVVALLRGVAESPDASVNEDNTHPFSVDGVPTVLVHNGQLSDFSLMRFELLPHLKPGHAAQIRGCTDSEWIYHLFLSQLSDCTREPTAEQLVAGVLATIRILKRIRAQVGIASSSPLNIVVGHSKALVATRYTFDPGNFPQGVPPGLDANMLTSLSLFFRGSRESSVDREASRTPVDRIADNGLIVASEPTQTDASAWQEVPRQHLLVASRSPELTFEVRPIDDGDLR